MSPFSVSIRQRERNRERPKVRAKRAPLTLRFDGVVSVNTSISRSPSEARSCWQEFQTILGRDRFGFL